MEGYDSHLFLEILLSEGIEDLGLVSMEGEVIQYLHGVNGKRVPICLTDEFIGCNTCKNYLIQLGIPHLIKALFPDDINKGDSASPKDI